MARSMPDWPAMMKRPLAAAYCDMTGPEFEREVLAGHLPLPVQLGDGEKWRRSQLDESLDRLTGDGPPDWRGKQPLYRKRTG